MNRPSPEEQVALAPELQPTAAWAQALLRALTRDEVVGRRPPRLTEPRLATWTRFRGRLTSTDLVALLFEDAAVVHRIPFDADAVGGPLRLADVPETVSDAWLRGIDMIGAQPSGPEHVAQAAALLGVPTRLARSELHVVKPHQKVLELPGTGGQLAHHLTTTQRDLTLQDNFVIACSSWQEAALAGIVALERGAPHASFVMRVDASALRDPAHPLRQRTFDFVIGLHPDKGGLYQYQEQLALWFQTATIVLV